MYLIITISSCDGDAVCGGGTALRCVGGGAVGADLALTQRIPARGPASDSGYAHTPCGTGGMDLQLQNYKNSKTIAKQ
ncbi:hypothetical protein DPMN_010119 [Dreissena polymorpha]|uniref:Uncharacterized protein n=1 Tax=Dreissena polymorpha TaxID=45954 RepID=A0A9D4N1H5_DREPO|nr:hypothetical protein DPMN_010119 [Dreissena polymorpha]